MCKCIERTNAAAIDQLGIKLRLSTNLKTGAHRTIVATEKVAGDEAKKKSKKFTYLVAKFCPFCGEKYTDGEESQSESLPEIHEADLSEVLEKHPQHVFLKVLGATQDELMNLDASLNERYETAKKARELIEQILGRKVHWMKNDCCEGECEVCNERDARLGILTSTGA